MTPHEKALRDVLEHTRATLVARAVQWRNTKGTDDFPTYVSFCAIEAEFPKLELQPLRLASGFILSYADQLGTVEVGEIGQGWPAGSVIAESLPYFLEGLAERVGCRVIHPTEEEAKAGKGKA